MRARRAVGFALLVSGFLIAIDQGVRFTVLADDQFAGARVPPFSPPPLDARERQALQRVREAIEDPATPLLVGAHAVRQDAELGWSSPADVSDSPARARRVVVIGGDGALSSGEAAGPPWPTLVGYAHQPGDAEDFHRSVEPLAVVSLAVAGHDAGQALLRLEREGFAFGPDEIWFVLRARDLARSATCFAPLVDREFGVPLFKPRFEMSDAASVRLVPPPARAFAESLALLQSRDRFSEACAGDPWAPDLAAPQRWFALTRLLAAVRVERRRAAALALEDEATLELGIAIVRRAAEGALRRGSVLRVILLPDANELASAPRAGERLHDALAAWGIEAFDLAPVMARAARAGAEVFADRTGELTEVGQAVVAGAVLAHRGARDTY